MSGKPRRLAALGVLFLLAAGTGRGEDTGYRVIVNPANPITSLSRQELSRMFLKRTVKWSTGEAIQAVDQSASSTVRERFSETVHGRSVAQIKNYWQQQFFSGKDVPPPEKASDREVLAFVQGNPTAIGYVSADTAVGNVKVVSVKE